MVGKFDGDIGKAQSVAMLDVAPHAPHTAHVAVGDEVHLLIVPRPEIVVLGHQQHVVVDKQVLAV